MNNLSVDLAGVRIQADKIKFCRGVGMPPPSINWGSQELDDAVATVSSLEVTRFTSRRLHGLWREVCAKLGVAAANLRLFVRNDPNVQAECRTLSLDTAIVIISSGLVRLLEEPEIAFVLGHELAHFIFLDGVIDRFSSSSDPMLAQREAEVSADRLGVFACEQAEAGLTAMIKTASGLDGEYVDPQLNDFLGQIETVARSVQIGVGCSHPPVVFRARALARFVSQVDTNNLSGAIDTRAVQRVNRIVAEEFDAYVNVAATTEADRSFSMWEYAEQLVGGSPDSAQWKAFTNEFGASTAARMKRFFEEHAGGDLLAAIKEQKSQFARPSRVD